MKATELRIGNYVYPGEDEFEDNAFVVDAGDILACRKGTYKYKPIPLTEEWLVKFGFKQCGEWFILNGFLHQNIAISIIHRKTTFGDNEEYEIENIKYVHQLQNLYFALTGKELNK